MSEEIRPAAAADLSSILAIMRSSLGWPSDARAEQLWRWKHEDNPFGPSPVWVGVVDGQVVAVRAFLRWELASTSGAFIRAVRAVDTATHPAYQGRGWFRRLTLHGLDALADEGVEVVFNTPNDASRPGYVSMGWTEQDRLTAWVRVRRPTAVPRIWRSRVPADLWPMARSENPRRTIGRPAPLVFNDEAALAVALSRAAESSCATAGGGATGVGVNGVRVSTNRVPAFYRWRYGLDALGYQVVCDEGGMAEGFVVVRPRRRGAVSELAVLDVVATPERSSRLLRRALQLGHCDHAVSLGHRPGGTWLRAPGLGPRLVTRSVAGGPNPSPAMAATWDLCLGDVELL